MLAIGRLSMTDFRFLRRTLIVLLTSAVIVALPRTASAAYGVQIFDDGVLQQLPPTTVTFGNSLIFGGVSTNLEFVTGSGLSNNPGRGQSSYLDASSSPQVRFTFG